MIPWKNWPWMLSPPICRGFVEVAMFVVRDRLLTCTPLT